MKTFPYGESAIYVDLELGSGPGATEMTHAVAAELALALPGAEIVVGESSLLLDGVSAWDDLEATVARALGPAMRSAPPRAAREHVVRAIYDGPDLDEVARASGRSRAEVVALHASTTYLVEIVGFLPGFAYLGELPETLRVARRPAPRPRVPPLSIGIAGRHTGVYPLASPGGWNLVARALDFVPFDPRRTPASAFAVGDRVRFEPVDAS